MPSPWVPSLPPGAQFLKDQFEDRPAQDDRIVPSMIQPADLAVPAMMGLGRGYAKGMGWLIDSGAQQADADWATRVAAEQAKLSTPEYTPSPSQSPWQLTPEAGDEGRFTDRLMKNALKARSEKDQAYELYHEAQNTVSDARKHQVDVETAQKLLYERMQNLNKYIQLLKKKGGGE